MSYIGLFSIDKKHIMNLIELEQQIRTLIAKDEIAAAIDLLNNSFEGQEGIDAIILQSGRYHSLKKEQLNGTIDFDTLQTSLNQLRANILSFVNTQKELLRNSANPYKSNTIHHDLKLSMARISILWLLVDTQQDEDGLSIKEICDQTKTESRKNIYESLEEMADGELVEKIRIGNNTFWKITEKGITTAEQFEDSPIWNPG